MLQRRVAKTEVSNFPRRFGTQIHAATSPRNTDQTENMNILKSPPVNTWGAMPGSLRHTTSKILRQSIGIDMQVRHVFSASTNKNTQLLQWVLRQCVAYKQNYFFSIIWLCAIKADHFWEPGSLYSSKTVFSSHFSPDALGSCKTVFFLWGTVFFCIFFLGCVWVKQNNVFVKKMCFWEKRVF